MDDRDWADQAEAWARKGLRAREKEISDEALAELISRVGPNARQLDNEVEKVSLYVGDRKEIEFEDVATDLHAQQDGPGLCAWAMRWATGTCRGCCAGWTRRCGR